MFKRRPKKARTNDRTQLSGIGSDNDDYDEAANGTRTKPKKLRGKLDGQSRRKLSLEEINSLYGAPLIANNAEPDLNTSSESLTTFAREARRGDYRLPFQDSEHGPTDASQKLVLEAAATQSDNEDWEAAQLNRVNIELNHVPFQLPTIADVRKKFEAELAQLDKQTKELSAELDLVTSTSQHSDKANDS